MPEMNKETLLKKAQLLWRLVTSTAGVADLAEPMKRVERNFDHLSKGQRLTIAVIAAAFDRGIHAIDKEAEGSATQAQASQGETKPETVAAEEVEIIPPEGNREA